MDCWTRLDGLVASRDVVIDRPKGTTHPRFPGLVYPLDYGYLKGTSGGPATFGRVSCQRLMYT